MTYVLPAYCPFAKPTIVHNPPMMSGGLSHSVYDSDEARSHREEQHWVAWANREADRLAKRSLVAAKPTTIDAEATEQNTPLQKRSSYGNPDPHRFRVLNYRHVSPHLVMRVQYPDCFNYEGVKVLVYLDTVKDDVVTQPGGVEPHFNQHPKHKSPFARFEPTARGWEAAIMAAVAEGGILKGKSTLA